MAEIAEAATAAAARFESMPASLAAARAAGLPDYLPARMVHEFIYCPRVFFYEWVDGLFAHSSDTVEGALRHGTVDTGPTELAAPGDDAPVRSRSVELASETHRLIAKIDLLEGEGGAVWPVEYKKGRPRDGDDGPEAWPSDRVQVAVQALVLRDSGYKCDEAIIYYSATRQRVHVRVDAALIEEALHAASAAREAAASGKRPPPLVDSPKCARCSLVGICLPDETRHWELLADDEPQLALFAADTETRPNGTAEYPAGEVRRLIPARDDLRPLYITGYDLIVGKTGEVVRIKQKSKIVQDVRINEISHVNVFGNVSMSAAVIQGLCEAERPIAHFSYGGWFYGLTHGLELKNVFLRRDQFALANVAFFCTSVARRIVHNKIRNQRRLLIRNHVDPPKLIIQQLQRYADAALQAASLETLLGIEGTASRLYFKLFQGLLKTETGEVTDGRMTFDFEGRNRRPPRDPINALLSFAYSLLTKDLTIIAYSVGFDPFMGFYHQPRFGRPALALDLMEAFRPLIADSAVITAINTRMVTADDFVRVGPAVALTAKGRKAFLRAYEQRMDTLVTHPQFGYRVNYRRILEVQTRLLARVVTGELSAYPGFETR